MARILSDTEVTMCDVPCCRLVRLWCCSYCTVAVQGARRRPDRHGIATLLYNVVNGERPSKKQDSLTESTTSPQQAFQERLWQQQLQAGFATLLGWDGYLGRGIYCWSSGGSRWARWLRHGQRIFTTIARILQDTLQLSGFLSPAPLGRLRRLLNA